MSSDSLPVLNRELLTVVLTILDSLDNDELSDHSLEKLSALFPQDFIVSALEMVDEGNVLEYILPWDNKTEYEVIGASGIYMVQLDLPAQVPFYCSCPAFTNSTLSDGDYVMCKHVLAAFIARRLSTCVERPLTADELLEVIERQHGHNH
ncbi:hypothetical protein BKA70DRAFT_1259690 [Coprinopsis sp. MPI-PUGE-AT-0042]|nr:hypothetical protein BKA70DRAFT_1259690 [Coprinopsis sp. MPI-PUGE-AT-0042]